MRTDKADCLICKKRFDRRVKGMRDRAYKKPLRPYRSLTCSEKCAVLYNRMPLSKRNLLKVQGGIMKMEIKSLKDLKLALETIPNEQLEDYGVSVDPEGEGVSLLCWDAESDPVEKYYENESKYPAISDIGNWIKAIVNLQKEYEKSDGEEIYEEMVSSRDVK